MFWFVAFLRVLFWGVAIGLIGAGLGLFIPLPSFLLPGVFFLFGLNIGVEIVLGPGNEPPKGSAKGIPGGKGGPVEH